MLKQNDSHLMKTGGGGGGGGGGGEICELLILSLARCRISSERHRLCISMSGSDESSSDHSGSDPSERK